MRFEFKPSFDRSVKNFHGKEKEEIKEVALRLKLLTQGEDLYMIYSSKVNEHSIGVNSYVSP